MSDLAVDNLITVNQAFQILDSVPLTPRKTNLPLAQSLGLYLAQDIHSDRDYPPFNKATMDGYAIPAVSQNQFQIVQTIMAGQNPDAPLKPDQAMAIMTGAPVPNGTAAVVPIEWTSRSQHQLSIHRAVKTGNAIAPQGSEARAGERVLSRGTLVGPAQIALLASVGQSTVEVFSAPRVALLSTGNELVDVDQTPIGAQIRNSNGPMLTALLTRLGCNVQDLGIIPDIPAKIESAILTGLEYDALFITGGMSMGVHDYVPQLLESLGLSLLISKLRIKPGKPFIFGTGRCPVFGLPGNPVSGFVCTILLANRILSRLRGGPVPANPATAAVTIPMPSNGPREFYMPAVLNAQTVTPLPFTGSADLITLANANCLVVRPENAPQALPGEAVPVIPFA